MVKQAQTTHPQSTKKSKNNVVKDERFRKLNYDPKFKPVPQDMKKIKVDSRFAGMMTKDKFKVVSNVDKYGRKIKNTGENKELKQYYEMEEEEEIEPQVEMEEEEEVEQHSLGSQEEQNLHDWMENYNQQSSGTESQLQIEELMDEQKQLWSDDEKVIKNQKVKVTKRLALCNYDWTHIKSSDLIVLFNSFKPATGFIEKVELYQSDFGKERMENESIAGPGDIWKKSEETNDKLANRKKILKKLFTHGKKVNQQTDIDMEKLRQYEKQRMRYYYAVIYCDTKQTAQAIYTLCDGKELENSNNIDLRYIPDDLVFPRKPEEVCDKLPQKSNDIKNKIMRSIGHSHVKLSWEDPEAGNLSKLKNMAWDKLKSNQYDGVDWSLYINDEMSEGQKEREKERELERDQEEESSVMQVEEEEEKYEKQRYRKNNKKDRASNNDQQMEIIFSGGFDLASKVKAKREEQLQKRVEKREVKKEKQQKKKVDRKTKKHQYQEDQEPEHQEQQVSTLEKEKRKNYLQLMVDKKKAKKDFAPNVSDPRFEDVYKNPNMQIDPNSSLFNPEKSGNIFKEVVRKAKNRNQ